MLSQHRPIAFTVERAINHIYMMYPTLTRQEVIRLVKRSIIVGKESFKNGFDEPVTLRYENGMWLILHDVSLHTERRFLIPQSLADIYLYGTLDRYPYFDPAPYRIDEKPIHRCRRQAPLTQKALLEDIESYFGASQEEVAEVLTMLLYIRKTFILQKDQYQIEFAVDDLSYPALGITRLNYGQSCGGEPRKKFTHYDLRAITGFLCHTHILKGVHS